MDKSSQYKHSIEPIQRMQEVENRSKYFDF